MADGLEGLARLIPQAMAAAGNSPAGVRNVIAQQQQMDDRREQENQRERLRAFGREIFSGQAGGGATPETIFAAAQKYSIPPGQAMKLASDFMAFRQARRQAEMGPEVSVSTPMEGGGYVRRRMSRVQASQYTAQTPGSFIGELYGRPAPQRPIQDPFRASKLGIFDTRSGKIVSRAPIGGGGGGMPKPRMLNIYRKTPEGGIVSAQVPENQYPYYAKDGWQFGELKPARTDPKPAGGLSDNSVIQNIRETVLMGGGNASDADAKIYQYFEAKKRNGGDREAALMEVMAPPAQAPADNDPLGIR